MKMKWTLATSVKKILIKKAVSRQSKTFSGVHDDTFFQGCLKYELSLSVFFPLSSLEMIQINSKCMNEKICNKMFIE